MVICSTETKISLFLAGHVRNMHKSILEVSSLLYLRGSSRLAFWLLSAGLAIMKKMMEFPAAE